METCELGHLDNFINLMLKSIILPIAPAKSYDLSLSTKLLRPQNFIKYSYRHVHIRYMRSSWCYA